MIAFALLAQAENPCNVLLNVGKVLCEEVLSSLCKGESLSQFKYLKFVTVPLCGVRPGD